LEKTAERVQAVSFKEIEPKPDFTAGGLSEHIVSLAVPSMLALVFQSAYIFVDMIWLGIVSKEAIAAVTIYWLFDMMLALFNQIVAMGSFSLIARSYGAKDYEETSTVIGQTFVFKMFVAIPAAVLGYFLVYDAFKWYGATEHVAVLGQQYGRVMLVALPIYYTGFTISTALRSIGDVKKPMILAAITMGMNIALDPLFIFGIGGFKGWGVAGAAFASVLCQMVFFVVGLYWFFSGKTFVRLSLRHVTRPSPQWILKFVRVGAPAAVGDACRFSSQFFLGRVVLGFGTAAVAALGIGAQLLQLSWIPLFGIASSTGTLVGQNLGAGKSERAEKTVLLGTFLVIGIMSAISVLSYIFAADFVRIFSPDAEVIQIGRVMVRFGALVIMFISVTGGLAAAFLGSGDTVPLAIIQAIYLWGIQNPLVLVFVKGLGLSVEFVWLSMLIAEFSGCLITMCWFSKGKWKHKKV
jgi:putative MATE family efflux protein